MRRVYATNKELKKGGCGGVPTLKQIPGLDDPLPGSVTEQKKSPKSLEAFPHPPTKEEITKL